MRYIALIKFFCKDFSTLTKSVIEKRNELNQPDSGDFIDRIRDLVKQIEEEGGKSHGITTKMAYAQGLLFIFAGFDTTSTTLANCFYLLSKDSDVQERCFQEISDALEGDEEFSYQTVSDLKYLEAVILETLRLYPIATRNMRVCKEDTEVCGIKVKRGVRIDVPTYTLHRHPDYFGSDAEEFNPDRFISGGVSLNDMTYQPFGDGPRICIGMRLAMHEMKVILAKILYNFRIVDDPTTKISFVKGSWFGMAPNKFKGILEERK